MTGLQICEMTAEGFVAVGSWCGTCRTTTEHLVGETVSQVEIKEMAVRVVGVVESWCTDCGTDQALPELTVDEAVDALGRDCVFAVHGTYWPGA